MEEEEVLLPFYDWKPVQFGICNHQVTCKLILLLFFMTHRACFVLLYCKYMTFFPTQRFHLCLNRGLRQLHYTLIQCPHVVTLCLHNTLNPKPSQMQDFIITLNSIIIYKEKLLSFSIVN